MLISEHIMRLQKILEDHGDQDLYMWVDEDGQQFLYPVRVPEIEVSVIDGNEYQILPELRDCKEIAEHPDYDKALEITKSLI